MIGENDFETAAQDAVKALFAVRALPHSEFRDYARDNLAAAIGWIKQARDEWATEQARK